MSKTFLALFLQMFLVSQNLFAGWQSGGGELQSNAKNPYFLENTRDVTYCLKISPNGFAFDEARLHTMIEESFAYWKEEFEKSTYSSNNSVHLATQNFVFGACDQYTDLVFQFGFLTEEQKIKIPDFKNFVSLAIRTEYDEVNLKGKGFIYISSEEGEFRPKHTNLLDRYWSDCNGCRLKRVVSHELGHVFGIQHINDSMSESMMAAVYPFKMVTEKFYPKESSELLYVFGLPQLKKYKYCKDRFPPKTFLKIAKFFDIPAKYECFQFDEHLNGIGYKVFLSESEYANNSLLWGEIESVGGVGAKINELAPIYLNDKQQVYPWLKNTTIGGGGLQTTFYKARFKNLQNNLSKILRVEKDNSSLRFDIYEDNQENSWLVEFVNLGF